MSGTVPTPITDRNGKQTTVHKKVDGGKPANDRAKNVSVPAQVEDQAVVDEKNATLVLDNAMTHISDRMAEYDSAVHRVQELHEQGYEISSGTIEHLASASAHNTEAWKLKQMIEYRRSLGDSDLETKEGIAGVLLEQIISYSNNTSSSQVENKMRAIRHDSNINAYKFFSSEKGSIFGF